MSGLVVNLQFNAQSAEFAQQLRKRRRCVGNIAMFANLATLALLRHRNCYRAGQGSDGRDQLAWELLLEGLTLGGNSRIKSSLCRTFQDVGDAIGKSPNIRASWTRQTTSASSVCSKSAKCAPTALNGSG